MKATQREASKRFCAGAGAAFAATLAFPALAFAAEVEEGEGAGIGAILPNMTEFIPMLVAFILLAIILWKLGWPMFEGMLEKRRKTIEDSIMAAENAKAESERLLEEHKQQLAGAKAQAAQIIADAKKSGEALRSDMTSKAQADCASMIEQAKVAIEAERKSAIAELQGSAADLSVAVASKFIGSDLSDAQQRAIIERYVNEAGSFNAN